MSDDGEDLKFHGSPLASQPSIVVNPHVGLPGSSLQADDVVSLPILAALTVKPFFPRITGQIIHREAIDK